MICQSLHAVVLQISHTYSPEIITTFARQAEGFQKLRGMRRKIQQQKVQAQTDVHHVEWGKLNITFIHCTLILYACS